MPLCDSPHNPLPSTHASPILPMSSTIDPLLIDIIKRIGLYVHVMIRHDYRYIPEGPMIAVISPLRV